MSSLCYLCLLAYSGVQHISCCVFLFVFLRLVYPMLPVSLDCPFLIAHSVFSNVYLPLFVVIFLCILGYEVYQISHWFVHSSSAVIVHQAHLICFYQMIKRFLFWWWDQKRHHLLNTKSFVQQQINLHLSTSNSCIWLLSVPTRNLGIHKMKMSGTCHIDNESLVYFKVKCLFEYIQVDLEVRLWRLMKWAQYWYKFYINKWHVCLIWWSNAVKTK